MRFKTLKGRDKSVAIHRYVVDWDSTSLSKFQFAVKQFLRQHWANAVVCEELPVAGTRMRLDFYNATKRIAVECDGVQHNGFNKHFHRGSLSVFQQQIGRDNDKQTWCDLNGITLVRIFPTDVEKLSRAWFKDNYEVDL